jgi:hypothetical protein
VKEYDKLYINVLTWLAAKAAERYETTFQVYREAAAGQMEKQVVVVDVINL